MYGNRGVLHNDDLALVRRYQVRRWLVCVLEFRGRRRPVMRPRRYTGLFFLDEAVALAAGHRPCAECRPRGLPVVPDGLGCRPRPARETRGGRYRPGTARGAPPGGRRPRHLPRAAAQMPNGVFIAIDGESWLVHGDGLRRWTPAGYAERIDRIDGPAAVLTPRATVAAIRAGYRPLLHPSIQTPPQEETGG